LNPEHRPLNAVMAQRIFKGWEEQHVADLEKDFNSLGLQNDISSNDEVEYIDPTEYQPAGQLDPPLVYPLGLQDDIPSDDDLKYVNPVARQPAEQLDPPFWMKDDMPSENDLEYVDPAQQRPAKDLDPAVFIHIGISGLQRYFMQ
ncbi:hypothetical protein H2248_001846, partial [Termitomyces sp. 'cryptogamus']